MVEAYYCVQFHVIERSYKLLNRDLLKQIKFK